MRIRALDYFVILLSLLIVAVLFAAIWSPAAHSHTVFQQQSACFQYDMSRGERIATAWDHHFMEQPERIKPEVLSLLSQTTKEWGLEGDLESLAESIAGELKGQAKFKDAIEVYTALIETEQRTRTNSISLVDTYNSLAEAYVSAKEFNKAEQTLQKALTITEGFHGKQSYETARCLDLLADLQKEQKNHKSELALREQAHQIRVIVYGTGNDYLVESYANLADLALRTGDKTKAINLYIEGLKIADHHPSGSQARELRQRIRALCTETPKK